MAPHGWDNPAGRVDTPASPVLPLEGAGRRAVYLAHANEVRQHHVVDGFRGMCHEHAPLEARLQCAAHPPPRVASSVISLAAALERNKRTAYRRRTCNARFHKLRTGGHAHTHNCQGESAVSDGG